MNKTNKKIAITTGCSLVGALVLVSGAFALFHSEKTIENAGTLTVGSVSLDPVNIVQTPSVNKETSVTTDSKFVNGNLSNLNPGDIIPFEFKVKNTGNKSVREKSVVYIIFDNNGTGSYGQYSNFINSIEILDENSHPIEPRYIKSGMVVYNRKSCRALEITAPYVTLNGTGDLAETENGVTSSTATHKYVLKFDRKANVHTQNQSLTIKTFSAAVQFRNSNETNVDTELNKLTKSLAFIEPTD